MATLSIGFIKSKPNKDGSYSLKLVINSLSNTAYISTRYKIDNLKQWKDGRVIKHPDADYINKQLKNLLWEYEVEKSVQIAPCRRKKIDPLVKIRLTPKKSWRRGSI